MARMTNGWSSIFGPGIDRILWETRRAGRAFTRRFGASGWSVLALIAVGMIAWCIEVHEREALGELTARAAARTMLRAPAPGPTDEAERADGRTRLKAFEDYLPAHEDIPTAVQDLLQLAQIEDLSIRRGEYRPQPDPVGGFFRYRMSLPVRGEAPAVRRFMQAALRTHKTLALESVQFVRERSDSQVIEARIQWVLLTRLPAAAPAHTASLTVGEGLSR